MFSRDVSARRLHRLGPVLATLLLAAACSNGAPPPSLAKIPAARSGLSTPLYSEGFETGLDGWTAQTTAGVATWHVQTHPENVSVTSALNPFAVTLPDNGAHLPAAGGTNVAWFGDDSTGSYIGADYVPSSQTAKGGGTSKEAQSGNVTSPPISLAGVTKALLEFDSWWEIEGVAGQSYDIMTVQVSKDTGATWTTVGTLNPTFATNQPGYAGYSTGGPSATPQWRHYGYDLSSYAGQSVLVRFRFDTGDTNYNGFRGWTVDNVAMSGGTTLPAPTLSAVSPSVATAGDVVHVTGTNFFQGATFFLGTTQIASGSITQFGVNEMIFKAPTLTPGAYDVKVVNPDGQTATLPAAFTYAATASPTVSSVSPSSAQINTAQSVTLTGTNFAAGATVSVGSAAATSVTVVSATQITAQIPALGAGTYNITVKLPSGQSGTGYALYSVADKSTLAMTAPSGGESWASGSTHNLTWNSTIATVVSLDLYRSGGFVQNIAASIPATPGSYAWTIPTTLTLGGGYAIRISNPQGTTNATSAGTFTIAPASVATSVALAASSTAVVGQSISFTATLTPAASTGSVQFTVDGAALGTPVAVSGGTATSPAKSWTGAGSHTVVAAFTGSGTFSNSSAQITETVGAAATSSSVTSSGPGAYGQSVTFTASVAAVAPGAGTPAGTVQFFDGATSLGSATLANGSASLPVSTLSVGSHDITVQYGGTADFAASTSPSGALPETVNPGPASLSATFSPAAPVNGQAVTVTVTAAGGGVDPGGQVTLKDGGVALGTVALSGGTVAFIFPFGAGVHSFVLSYSGDANYVASDQSGGSLTVAAASTNLSLSSSGSGTYGQQVTFTARVSAVAPGAGSPDGTVTFFADGAQLGSAALTSGRASFSTSGLQVGSHAMTATYGGSPSFVTSGGSMTESVAVGNAPTVVAVSPAAPVFGQPVVLTIAVNAAGTGAAATGSVTVSDGSVVLQTVPLSSSGASFTTAALSVGSHSLTVSYSGDANYGASTSSTTVVVGKAGSGLAFSAAPSSAVSGQSVTLTATLTAVAPGAGTPQGSVAFSDGATSLGSAVLSGGVATLNVSTLAVGTHALTASFAGSSSFNASSGSASATIAQGATSVSLTASTGASTYGSPVTLTCAVSAIAPATGTPSGTVTFLDGTTVLGTGTLDASGAASFTLSSLGAGAHSLTASYAGDTGFAAAATSGSTSLTVAKAAASLALSASAPTAVAGQTVSFTLAATSPGGVPGGTASLFDGSTALGNGSLDGSGSLTVTASFHAGTHALRAVYAGSANFVAAPDASITYAVAKAATALSLQGPAASTWVNRPVTFVAQATATAPGSGLPAGTVTFSDGATVLGSAALDGSGSASFTVPSLTSGSHPIAASYAGSVDFLGSSGTLAGGQAIQKSDPVAGSGTAVALDGSTQAVSVAANPALDGARTVELWFRAAASAASAPGPACLAQQGAGANLRFGLCLTAARDGFEIRRGADRQTIPAMLSPAWHHVALVDEENSTVLVLDGVAVGTVNGGFATAAGQPLVLGAAQAPAGGSARSDFFGGQLDELRLWVVPRTAQDLAAARQQPQTGQEQGLTALWRMDEGQGAQLYDAGAAHLVATLESSTASSWVPSTAWSQRTTPEERAMAPFVAGYDPDGAPVTAVLLAQPVGVATASAASISYSPPRQFTGKDAFTYQVGSGPLGRFSVEVAVTHIDQCQVQLDCAGGDVCTNGRCMAPASLHTLSGGCSTTPDSSSFALLPLVLVAGFLAMRRRARA